MKRLCHFLIALLAAAFFVRADGAAQDNVKLAQTGMQFLSVVSDARAGALGNAVTTLPLGSASLFFNPAGMAESNLLEFCASYNRWIADIKHMAFSISVKPWDGSYGVFGLSVQTVDYGEILGTIVATDPTDRLGYIDFKDLGLSNPKPSGLAVGLGYAKSLSEQFAIGVQVRWVRQNLGDSYIPIADTGSGTTAASNRLNPLVFDFGTLFKTGFKSLTFGMSIRNFSTEVQYVSESFELPLTITFGLSIDVMDFIGDRSLVHGLLITADAVHNRDYREQAFFGAECNLLDFLALRGGLITNSDEDRWTFGFGVWKYGLEVDYAYTPFGVFDKVERVTLRFSM